MIKISKLADYSTVVMHRLSSHQGHLYSAAAISEQTCIAMPTVSKILKLLNDAGLLTSSRGSNGGYQLAKSPEKISLAEIISAIDGKPAITECSSDDGLCAHDHYCKLRGNWQYINRIIYGVLDKISLLDMGSSLEKSAALPLQFYPSKNLRDA